MAVQRWGGSADMGWQLGQRPGSMVSPAGEDCRAAAAAAFDSAEVEVRVN